MSRETVGVPTLDPGMVSPYAEGWDTIEHQERYEAGEIIAPDDFYGFGHIELTIGHGSWTGGHHYQWALDKGVPHELLRAGSPPGTVLLAAGRTMAGSKHPSAILQEPGGGPSCARADLSPVAQSPSISEGGAMSPPGRERVS